MFLIYCCSLRKDLVYAKRNSLCETNFFLFYEKEYTDYIHKDIKLFKAIEFLYIVLVRTVTQAQLYISFLLVTDICGCISHSLKAAQSFQAKKTNPFCIHDWI